MAFKIKFLRGISSVELIHNHVGACLACKILSSIRKLDFFAIFNAQLFIGNQRGVEDVHQFYVFWRANKEVEPRRMDGY